ncbi:MAG: DUF167 domain-containing protein [Promethearchaeota archaeon]
MKFLKKYSDTNYIIRLIVKPNSRRQDIIDNGEFLTILIRSKAKQNRANIELINLLKKKLNISSNQIKIVSGLKTTNKAVQLKFNKKIETHLLYSKLFS